MLTQTEFCSMQHIAVDEVEDWNKSMQLASKIIKQLPDTSGMGGTDRLRVFLDSMKLLGIRVDAGDYSENNAYIAMLIAKSTFKAYEDCFRQWEIKVLQGKMTLGSQPLLASKFMQKLHQEL